MNRLKSFIIFLSLTVLMLPPLLTSCSSKDEPVNPDGIEQPVKPEEPVDRTVLVYSVAANNLITYLRRDSAEMVKGAPAISGLTENVRLLLYFATGTNCTLSELRMRDGEPSFRLLKRYPLSTLSTDPKRLAEVIDDMQELRPADKYGIIFESHGTGWVPDFLSHEVASRGVSEDAEIYPSRFTAGERPAVPFSFGDDRTNGARDSFDIDEMAAVLPDGMFDFIWFDACYMAGIETVYQFRNKCDHFIGYVIEIGSEGMPYDMILPYIVRPRPALTDAARTLFDSYNDYGNPVSVTVIDTSGLEALAAASRPLLPKTPGVGYTAFLQKYSRFSTGPFYDFRQYAEISGANLQASQQQIDAFHTALDNCVMLKLLSSRDFNNNSFSQELFGGLNCHVPGMTYRQDREDYYLTLDWSKSVFD